MQGRPGCTGSKGDVIVTSLRGGPRAWVPRLLRETSLPTRAHLIQVGNRLGSDVHAGVLSTTLQPWSVYNVDTTSLQHSKVHTRK